MLISCFWHLKMLLAWFLHSLLILCWLTVLAVVFRVNSFWKHYVDRCASLIKSSASTLISTRLRFSSLIRGRCAFGIDFHTLNWLISAILFATFRYIFARDLSKWIILAVEGCVILNRSSAVKENATIISTLTLLRLFILASHILDSVTLDW